ncbi:hypothetical protein [Streptomyces sp. NPDC005009]
MTWSAAVPGAALRAMRTAAGWRAVRLALLVGAVFVLGVLCGERARAADGGPVEGTSSATGASAIGSVTAGSVVPTGSGTAPDSNGPASLVEALTVPRPDVADPIRPLTETVVRSVDERVVRPVGELVGTVTDRLDEATPGELPTLPTLPALPMLPGLEQPAPLPELPHLPDAPEQPLPGPSTPGPQPDTSTPPPDAPGQDAPDEPKGPDRPSGTLEPVAGPVAHGPQPARAVGATHDDHGQRPARDAVQDAVRAGDPAPAPAPHAPGAPAGQPDGTTGSRSAVDHGTPRHGDACAVTAHHRPPLRLVPGAAERAEATGTRDPYQDVPVSPA